MTEPTNEQIERAAKDAGWDNTRARAVLAFADNPEGDPSGETARSILAHARTIAEKEEAEAREARLREALGDIAKQKLIAEMDEPDGDYEYAYETMVRVARTALQENPDG